MWEGVGVSNCTGGEGRSVCVCASMRESVPSRGGVSQLVSGTLAKPDSHTFGIMWIVFQLSSVVYLPWAGNLREGSCLALVSDK